MEKKSMLKMTLSKEKKKGMGATWRAALTSQENYVEVH